MSRKRSVEDVQSQMCTPAEPMKSSRRSPPDPSDSSVASSTRRSEDSALRSSPTVSGALDRGSSVSSMPSVEEQGGRGEEAGSSESEESSLLESDDDAGDVTEDGSEGEDEIVTIGGPRKPRIARQGVLGGAPDLRARISALLPQLAAANDDLQMQGVGASMEEVGEGEEHIEMDLGLGVLEEKHGSDASSESEEEDEAEDGVGEDEVDAETADVMAPRSHNSRAAEDKELSVLAELMGKRSGKASKPGIQELG